MSVTLGAVGNTVTFATVALSAAALSASSDILELSGRRGLETLLRQAETVRTQAAKALGIDIDRVPRVQGNSDGFLPSQAYGVYISAINEIHINPQLVAKHPDLFPLEDVVPHEALVHGYLSNVRTAWAHQFPEQVQEETINLLTEQVRKGEAGSIVRKVVTKQPPKGSLLPQIQSTVQGSLEIPAEQRNKVYELMENLVLGYDTWVDKAHKFATPKLSEHATQIIRQLAEDMPGHTAATEKAITEYIEANLPQLTALRRKVIKTLIHQKKEVILADIPVLTRRERGLVADALKTFLENPERYTRQTDTQSPPELNSEAIRLLKGLLPEFSSFTRIVDSPELAVGQLSEYLNAQLLRGALLRQEAIIPKNERLSSVVKPLTQGEIAEAKQSFRGFISTVEGNLKVLAGQQTDNVIFSYTLGAWEELLARKTSSTFRLKRISSDIVRLKKVNANPSQNSALQAAIELQRRLQNDLRLIELSERYVALMRELDSVPRDPQVAREVEGIKQKIRACRKRLVKVESAQTRLDKKNSAPVNKQVGIDGISRSVRSMPSDESRLFLEGMSLKKTMEGLRQQMAALTEPENIIKTEQGRKLLEERGRLLDEIRQIAPNGTIHPLPAFFFKSTTEHAKYHKALSNAVLGAMFSDAITSGNTAKVSGIFDN